MQTSDLAAAEEALVMFRYKVRRALREQQGYECQETDGDFMLAFGTSADAVRFCLTVSSCGECVCQCKCSRVSVVLLFTLLMVVPVCFVLRPFKQMLGCETMCLCLNHMFLLL